MLLRLCLCTILCVQMIVSSSGARPAGATTAQAAAQTSSPACMRGEDVAAWPVRRQVAGMFMVGIPIEFAARARQLVAEQGLAGILVRGTPTKRSRAALQSIASARSDVPTFVAVDEEGGRVQHLKKAVGVMPSAAVMAATMSPTKVRALARSHGTAMRALGFNVDFAPILDLANGNGNGIGDRAWSADPAVTTAYGLAFSQGLLDAGIFPVVKHFPGHGHASGDSHQIGATTPPLEQLRAADLLPFAGVIANTTVGVMVGHLQVPGLGGVPATLSEKAIGGVLRGDLGFRGLVVTDSLSMWPITYHFSPVKAAELALRAGNDVLLYDDDPKVVTIIDGLTAVVQADPLLLARVFDANVHVLAAKGIALCAPEAPTTAPTLPQTSVPTSTPTSPLTSTSPS